MDQNDIIGISAVMAIACILSALLSSAVMSYSWASGCERYCEPFAMDRDNTYQYRVCYCMGQDK
jgi:hypothetical protein